MLNVSSPTVQAVKQSLDMAVVQQQYIAHNIANSNSLGFEPVRVSFSNQLEALSAQLNERNLFTGVLSANGDEPELSFDAPITEQNKLPLDREVANLAQNSLHFQALARSLNRYFGLMQIAASDGRK